MVEGQAWELAVPAARASLSGREVVLLAPCRPDSPPKQGGGPGAVEAPGLGQEGLLQHKASLPQGPEKQSHPVEIINNIRYAIY